MAKTTGALAITKTDLDRIIDHCVRGLPNEACGMLAGRDGRVAMVYCMTNARPGPSRYEMEPAEQFRVMKEIRASGLQMVGLFHSHPAGHAFPSSVDVSQAYWPGTGLPNYPEAVYVIISLRDRTRPEARAFSLDEGRVREVVLNVV